MVVGTRFHDHFVVSLRLQFLLEGSGNPHPDLWSDRMRNSLADHRLKFLGTWQATLDLNSDRSKSIVLVTWSLALM